MPSKMVTDRQKAAALLSGTVDVYADQASDVFLRLLEPHLDVETDTPDLVYLLRLMGRRLDGLRATLVEVDEAHQAEQKEDRQLRGQRDSAAEELRDLVVRLRGLVDNAYGAGTCLRVLNVEGRIPQDPVVLERVASRFLEGLNKGFLDREGPPLDGVAIDAGAWSTLLEPPLTQLRTALDGLSHETPETGNRLVVKTTTMEEYDRAYRATAAIVESLFRYVGRPDLAERIRPKQRTSSPLPDDDPDTFPDPGPDPDTKPGEGDPPGDPDVPAAFV